MTTLILGAAGFIGSAVTRRLASLDHNRVIGLVRTEPPESRIEGVRYITGDVSDRSTLSGLMSETDTVICCVSYVASDAQRCTQINDEGIKNAARAANDASVDRLIYVSTASVYGTGPFRNLPVDGVPLNPQSPASRSRAAGEQHIRDAGGLVVRPHLIYGPGDRWFIPGITSIVERIGAVIDEGSALLSTIHVDRLACGIVELAQMRTFTRSANVHLNDPNPCPVIDVLRNHHRQTGWVIPANSVDRSTALVQASKLGIDRRYIDMISLDHWFKSSPQCRFLEPTNDIAHQSYVV